MKKLNILMWLHGADQDSININESPVGRALAKK